jgi:Zn-dependent peptidase ImmA (M78 family)
MYSVVIRFVDIPMAIHGYVRESADGIFNVYINANLSTEKKIEAIIHELKHILLNHLHDDCKSVEQMEFEADYRNVQVDLSKFEFLSA